MSHILILRAPAREFPLRYTQPSTIRSVKNKSRAEVLLLYAKDVISDSTPETIELDLVHLGELLDFCKRNPDFRWSST